MAVTIGLSYALNIRTYPNYPLAVRAAAERLGVACEIRELSAEPAAIEMVDAVVLTGGPDVDPQRYGLPRAVGGCGPLDLERDAAEFEALERALSRQIPVLAVCRGMQLLNVHLGGTLVVDLPSSPLRHDQVDDVDTFHAVSIETDSALCAVVGSSFALANSAHHQAVDAVAAPLRVVARAEGGVVEAYEWLSGVDRSPLVAVQWHPERLGSHTTLGGPLFDWLVVAAIEYARTPPQARVELHA